MTAARILLAALVAVAVPTTAAAQTVPRAPGTWFYGISTGLGDRVTSGAFQPGVVPGSAGVPPSPRATIALDLDGGCGLGSHVAVFIEYEGGATVHNSFGWGSLAAHATLRGWVSKRVWVEAGDGPAELAYKPSSTATSTDHWWAPGFEAAGGYEIFQGPTITLHVFTRYAVATFNGVRQQNITFQIGLLGRR